MSFRHEVALTLQSIADYVDEAEKEFDQINARLDRLEKFCKDFKYAHNIQVLWEDMEHE